MSTEGNGRHSHMAGCPRGGGQRQAHRRHRAPEARAGSRASFIEAELGEERKEKEKMEEKLEINNENGKYHAFKEQYSHTSHL